MKKIIYETKDGISIIHPTKEGIARLGIEGIIKKDVPKDAKYKVIDESEIPTDRTFRDAWNMDLKEDITKSKEIWKDKVRRERDSLFVQNDLLLRDAVLENDKDKKKIGLVERDRLRDITKKVDQAKSINGIKKIRVNDKES